jgi:hypothetical protein
MYDLRLLDSEGSSVRQQITSQQETQYFVPFFAHMKVHFLILVHMGS